MKLHPLAFVVCALVVVGFSAPARAEPLRLGIEPLVGYELVRKLRPTEHSSKRFFYGGRLTLGVLLLSLEGEYTRGTNSETYDAQGLTFKDTADRAKVGLRSGLRLSSLLRLYARAGGQASRNKHEEIAGANNIVTWEPTTIRPYGGAGFRVALSSKFAFTADVVAVINDFHLLRNNEYQTTAGFVVRLP
ncbi:outer membrane beta-barrel protein [Bdellovibrionota bacterium FG-2]